MRDLQKAHDEFIEGSVWHGSLDRSAEVLSQHPEIAMQSIYAASILGDAATVRAFLARDAATATAKGGPRGWDPLTYLCFSKYLRLEPARTPGFVDAATALLDAGADPNTGFYAGDRKEQSEWECALYGAAGVAHHPELTRLLIDRGADPNDGEVAYHSPETLDNRAMQVVVESGKLTQASLRWMLVRKLNWHDESGFVWLLDHGIDPNAVSHWKSRPLEDALANGVSLHYFEHLLDRGADPTLPSARRGTIFAAAARMARVDVLDLFQRRGFSPAVSGDDAFLVAAARGDEAAVRRMATDDPDLLHRVQLNDPTLLIEFAGADNSRAAGLLLDLGFDIAAARTEPTWSRGLTALHEAIGHCRLETVRLLIDRGAPLDARHERSGRTPADVALLCITQQSEWTPDPKSIPIARVLLDAAAPFDQANMTLAAAVCLGRREDIARLSRGATPHDKQLALAAAAFNGHADGVRHLLSLGVDRDATHSGLEHAAPLHNAVSSGSLATVRTLVEAGASLETRDLAYRLRAVDWAEWYVTHCRDDAREYAAIFEYLGRLSA